jgi:sortase A
MRYFAALLILAGLLLTWSGSWIQIKAAVAQVLLKHSWQQTLSNGGIRKPWPWADHWSVARLIVPSKEIDQIVLSGESGNVLAFAPGHNNQSARPGEEGTVVISGHRDTHFRFLEGLSVGHPIYLETRQGVTTYQVSHFEVVDSNATRIRLDDELDQLLLVTCYPFDALEPHGPLRYIVMAQRVHRLS